MCCDDSIKNVLMVVTFICFPIFGFAQFVTLSVWYSRIHPYFKESQGIGLKVYSMVSKNFYLSLVIFIIALLAIIIFACCCKGSVIETISGSLLFIAIVMALFYGANAFFGNYTLFDQMKVSLIAIKNGKERNSDCYLYLADGLKNADKVFQGNSKYEKWRTTFINRAFDGNNKTTNYLCRSVGAPTFAFAFLNLFFFLCMIFILSLDKFFIRHDPLANIAFDGVVNIVEKLL